ncbi:MAG TPA: hypothetical protein VN920_15870 [Pyrinomonadaceae bacterium]|nr:hypothetical protein [Pyrinomonadaceae bacterium]
MRRTCFCLLLALTPDDPKTKGRSSVKSNNVPDFDIEGIFGALANGDYDRAVELARGF